MAVCTRSTHEEAASMGGFRRSAVREAPCGKKRPRERPAGQPTGGAMAGFMMIQRGDYSGNGSRRTRLSSNFLSTSFCLSVSFMVISNDGCTTQDITQPNN
jgi:hypothetical protein